MTMLHSHEKRKPVFRFPEGEIFLYSVGVYLYVADVNNAIHSKTMLTPTTRSITFVKQRTHANIFNYFLPHSKTLKQTFLFNYFYRRLYVCKM
jgi:hypothetical protein